MRTLCRCEKEKFELTSGFISLLGVEFLRSQDAVMCQACKVVLPIGLKGLESHMTCIEHYNAVLDYLREKVSV